MSQAFQNAPSVPSLSRSQWRVVALASLGGSLEYYDFIIYGIFAQYIAKQFFPATDPYVSLILSFSVLALGFLARPLGGIMLSALGDRFGRRPVFLASLFCTTAATILIGLLPSYATLGLAAPLLLVGLRLIQGICLGGELPGAVTYAVETAPRRSGLACGCIILCVNGGVLIATLVNLGIQYALPPADVASYGWRIAFLLGGFVGCVSYLMRRSLEESPEFLQMHSPARHPIRELLRAHLRAVVTAAAVAVVGGFNGMLYGFIPAYLVQGLHYSPSQTALGMTTALLVSSAGLIVEAIYIAGCTLLTFGSTFFMRGSPAASRRSTSARLRCWQVVHFLDILTQLSRTRSDASPRGGCARGMSICFALEGRSRISFETRPDQSLPGR